MRRPLPQITVILIGFIAALAAACGNDEAAATPAPISTPPEPAATSPAPAATAPAPSDTPETAMEAPDLSAAVQSSQHPELGDILTDASGSTLYLFTRDARNESNCSGDCAANWPPLLTMEDPQAAEGLDGERLATITREDGSLQVTYNGWPLYYFANDAQAGDTNGQDVGNVWFVVSEFGGPVATSAAVNLAEADPLGNILVDSSGRSVYLFTKDEREKSNCSGGCALAWPPVLTVEGPAAGEGLDAERLSTITRDGGSEQVTYNGWPLYYFANDQKPGDANGQDVGNVWFVVSEFGGPVVTSAAVNLTDADPYGSILADASGRSLYLFTKDEREKSNCSGGCALAWPPVLTVEGPAAGEGLDAERLATITRDDGSLQVTYNGWPLYYFANDQKPGDANGQDVGNVWYVVSEFGGPIATSAAANLAEADPYGNILVDASGRAVYLFTKDEREKSNCSGGCALAWPPMLTVEGPAAGEGLDAERLATITRDDGSLQVTYNGWPLYYFFKDTGPGDTQGQYGTWFVVSEFGGPIATSAAVNLAETDPYGNILADASGRAVYLFTNDEREKSNCSGGCALAWPPVLTTDAPLAGEGVDADLLGTIERDASLQVTYDGQPLYYYAGDTKPGDTAGQSVGGVWYVVSPAGDAVTS